MLPLELILLAAPFTPAEHDLRIDSVSNDAPRAPTGGLDTLSSRSRIRTAALASVLAVVVLAGCSQRQPASQGNNDDNAAKASPKVSSQTPSQASSHVPADEPVALVASEVGPSVVQVNVRAVQRTPFGTRRGQGIGSGVIYRPDGYIITNNHVVEDATGVNVAFADGTTERASVVGTDPNTEIAVLKVNRNNLPAAAFVQNTPIVGQLAVAIGSPSGFESTVTSGIVSGVGREFPSELTGGGSAARALVDLIQTDAAISPGNSGGALADRDGRIIGINVAYLPPQQTGAENLGFAIPSDTAVSVADQLIDTGKVSTAYLGVFTTDLSPEDARRFDLPVDSGALVEQVVPGSAAADAGVRKGDIITGLGDAKVESYGDLLGALRDYQPGDTVSLTVLRNGDETDLEVTLGEKSR
jgi:S1-C subfamily serine protease